jgi:hypothetical protein
LVVTTSISTSTVATTNKNTILSISMTAEPHHLRWSFILALHQPSMRFLLRSLHA